MAVVSWDTTTTGNVTDPSGATVGTANGAGIITITAANITVNQDSLTILPGVTVKFAAGSGILVGSGGTFNCLGTAANPNLLTSNEASPAVGDWDGISTIAASAATMVLSRTTIEYCASGIVSVAGGAGARNVSCTNCTFRRIENSHFQAGDVTSGTWTLTSCVHEKCPADQTGTNDLIVAASAVTMSVSQCSIYAEYNIASDIHIFSTNNTATMLVSNTIFEGTNNNAGGDCNAAEILLTSSLTPTNNWYVVDGVNDYVPDGDDVIQDANFFNDTCPGPLDLRPDGDTGAATANSAGALIGALDPWNVVPTGGWTGGEPEDRESHGPKLPSDKTGRILFGAPQRKLGDVSDVIVRGTVIGLNGTTTVYKEDITSRREVARTSAGSFQLPNGAVEEVNLANMTSARVLLVESSVSCTLTFSGDQKVNIGGPKGFALLHIWRNRNVNNFTVTQSRETTATINWFGGQ
jgi:hypothetical protein